MATVLVVDDDHAARRLLVRILDRLGHRAVEASTGLEALEVLRSVAGDAEIDTVLLDLGLPDVSGYEVMAALKAEPNLRDVPVVFVTGSRDDALRAFEAGAHDYLIKPFDHGDLVARLHAALRVKALQDELKRRNAELERIARSDHLTGLANRLHLNEHLAAMTSAARRHAQDLSVLMVDLDHFKRLNDSHGHEAGDAVLVEVARRIQAGIRDEDVAGRWGGEEFQILLPFTGEAGAAVLAERVRGLIAESPVELAGGIAVPVTASIGGATSPCGGREDVVPLADQALYEAKGAGRNCIRIAPRLAEAAER